MLHTWWLWTIVGYLCGSVPFAYLLGRSRGVDIRKVGSGNVGATNLGRTLGRKWGIACFVLDVFKGTLPVLLAGLVMGYASSTQLTTAQSWQWLSVAVAAVMGHTFPIWLKFKGGKGVATGLGVLLGFWPVLTLPGLAAAVTWALCLTIWRYVGLASVIAAVALPGFVLLLSRFVTVPADLSPFLLVTLCLALLVVVRHRSNLARVWRGTEPKVGQKKH